MSPRANPISKPLPTVAGVFQGHSTLMTAFGSAGVTSIVQVMLLPREVLMELKGIDTKSSRCVSNKLRLFGLTHRDLCTPMKQFVADKFGGIENTPIQALSIVVERLHDAPHPHLWPLRLLDALQEIEPNTVVMDLIQMGGHGIRATLEKHPSYHFEADVFYDEIDELNWRLAWWNPSMHIAPSPPAPIRHLKTVVSE